MSRYHGLDAHKDSVYLCVRDEAGTILREERLTFGSEWKTYCASLTPEDEVVLEASTQVFDLYDQLAPHAGRAVVAHPADVRLVAKAHFKSDRLDADRLSYLLRLNAIPEVWIPPEDIRTLRALLSQRQSLQKESTRRKNVLHSLLHAHGHTPPMSDLFSQEGRQWLGEVGGADPVWLLQVNTHLALLEAAETAVQGLDAHLVQVAQSHPLILRLMQQAGLDWLGALILYAAIGDISRFPSEKHLASYLGLVPSLAQSGQKRRQGSITKAGRKQPRWLLVEAARVAIRYDGTLQACYERIAAKKGSNVAIVAIARKLAVRTWHIWHEDQNARTLDVGQWTRKLQKLAWQVGQENLPQGSREFIRQTAEVLGVELTEEQTRGRYAGRKGRDRQPVEPEPVA